MQKAANLKDPVDRIELCVAATSSDSDVNSRYCDLSSAILEEARKTCGLKPILRLAAEGKLSVQPHVTLYQFVVEMKDYSKLIEKLDLCISTYKSNKSSSSSIDEEKGKDGAKSAPSDPAITVITAKEEQTLQYNSEGSIEAKVEKTAELLDLQQRVLECCNEVRGKLLVDKTPDGSDPWEQMMSFEKSKRRKINENKSESKSESEIDRSLERKKMEYENLKYFGWAEGSSLYNPHVTLAWVSDDCDCSMGDPVSLRLEGAIYLYCCSLSYRVVH